MNYWPDGARPYEDVPEEGYPDAGTWAAGQYGATAQPGYPYAQDNGAPQWPSPGGQRAAGSPQQDPRRGYPPPPRTGPMPARGGGPRPAYPPGPEATRPYSGYGPQGYPADSGPMPAYQAEGYPADSGPMPAYQAEGYPADSGPMPAYRAEGYPADSAPMPAYQAEGYPADSGPMRAYRPQGSRQDSGSMPAYRPSGPMQAYRPSGPMPAYRPSGPMPAYRPGGNPVNSGPLRAYRPESGPMPAYRPGGNPADSGPMRAARRESGPMRAYQVSGDSGYGQRAATATLAPEMPPATMPAPRPSGRMTTIEDLLPGVTAVGRDRRSEGKVLEWLPFGNRLVLLPKEAGGTGESLREHRDTSEGWLRPAVFGAMDGLVTNSSLIAGIGAGGGGAGMIVLTGIAGLIAGAFSMATGEYISVKSQNELNLAEVELERKQHARDPGGKRARLAEIYMEKGVSPNLAEAVAQQISANPDRAVETHAREDLGIDPDDLPSPRTAAIASLASFTVGALIPLAPFLVGYPSLYGALGLAGVAAFAGGAAVARLTGRGMFLGGLRQFTAAFLGTGASFLVGHLIGGHVS